MEPSPCVPLAPALASTSPLLGVAALLNDSSFVVAVTAAAGGVSVVDGRSQELTRTWRSSPDVVLESAAVWDRSSDDEAGSPRLAILASSSTTSAAAAATASTSTSSTTDLLSWPASVPEGSIDAVADRVRLPSRPVALLSRGSKISAAAVVAFADGSGRSVRSLLQQRGGGGAVAAGNCKKAAFLACLSSSDGGDGASVVVSLVGADAGGVEGLSIRESRVDDDGAGGKGGAVPTSTSTSSLPAPLPAPAVALASAAERRAVVLCRDGTLLAFDLGADGDAASLAWRHRLAAFPSAAAHSSASAPTTPGSKKRGKAGGGSDAPPPPLAPALVVADAGRSIVAVYQSTSSLTPSNVVLRAVAVDAALGAPRGIAVVELPPSSSSASSAASISASSLSAAGSSSSALVVSLHGTAFVVAEGDFAAPAGVVGGHAGQDLASLVGALANNGGSGSSRLLAASAAAASGVAAFDDDGGEEEEAAAARESGLPLLVQPAWAAALGKLSSSETEATAAVAVPIPSLAAAAAPATAASSAAPPPPAHFAAAAEALKKMEAALVVAASQSQSQSKAKASAAATAAAAAARSWAEAAVASASTADDSDSASHPPPLPSDLHGRAASAAARLGHWEAVRAALVALPLTHGGSCAGLMPAAAAAGEFGVLAAVAASAPDAPPADVADVVSLALSSSPSNKNLAAARRAWRDTLTAAAEEAVAAAEEAAAAAAASSRGGSNPGMGPLASALAAEAATAVAAVSSFEGESSGELVLHALIAAPRDDAALQAALRAVPPGVAPALARYLAAWATALAPLPAVSARHQQQRGIKTHSSSRHHQQQRFSHPCGRLPTLSDVAAWASALVDAHLVALASAAAGGRAGTGAATKDGEAEATRTALEALRAVAAERAADAASLAPLFGAAGHVLCGSPLPSVAVAAAAAYSVEMLDLGVRR